VIAEGDEKRKVIRNVDPTKRIGSGVRVKKPRSARDIRRRISLEGVP